MKNISTFRFRFEGIYGDYTENNEVLYGLKLGIGPSFWMLDDGPKLTTLESTHSWGVDELRQVIFEPMEWDNIFPVITESGYVIFGNNPNVISREEIRQKIKELFSDYDIEELEDESEIYGISFKDVENGKEARIKRINESGIKEQRAAQDPFLKPIENRGQLDYEGDIIDVEKVEIEEPKTLTVISKPVVIMGAFGLSFDKKELAFIINKYQNHAGHTIADIKRMSDETADKILMAANLEELQFFDYRTSLLHMTTALGNEITEEDTPSEISKRIKVFFAKNKIPAILQIDCEDILLECKIEIIQEDHAINVSAGA